VPTGLNLQDWSKRLVDYDDFQIVELLKYGFLVGYEACELPVSEIKHHKGAQEFSNFKDDYLEKRNWK